MLRAFDPAGRSELAPASSAAVEDLRDAPRHKLVIRAVKLVSLGVEFVCLLRDVSETGASVSLFHDAPLGRSMQLEMQNGDRHDVELVWQQERKAGLRFVRRTDLARLMQACGKNSRRYIRVRLNVPARMFAGLRAIDCTILDISQQGAQISCADRLVPHQRIQMEANGLARLTATVRWQRKGKAGLLLEHFYQLGDLALLVSNLQTASSGEIRAAPST